jgi:hypothetical membrane protein
MAHITYPRVLTVRQAGGAVLFLVGAAFLVVTMLAASIAPGYDFHDAAISDLGVIDPTALLFNGLLVAIGALNLAGGYALFREHRRPWLLAIYVLAGLGAVGAGLFPLSTGAPHSLFALVAFLCFNLEAIATSVVERGWLRVVSIVAGIAGLAFVAVMIVGDGGNPQVFGAIGHGGTERMIVYPSMLWLLAFGGSLLAGDPD